MPSNPPPIDVHKWRARAASCRVWLCALLLWVLEHLGDGAIARGFRIQVRRDLNAAQRSVRGIIVLIALSRVSWTQMPGPSTWRPGAVVRTRSSADMRHCGRIVRFRARSLREKIRRLRAVIDALDAHVARMVTRIEAGLRQLGPVLIVAAALHAGLAARDAAIADSS
ncbi:MAG: hypothetical protein NW200_11120 [Hyphomonadaceae bacterium]|nr:hypothetical protein [Hyphomonadaceae bacterium]